MLITTSNWGFPFTKVDFRHITKKFLINRKTKVAAFEDNFPGNLLNQINQPHFYYCCFIGEEWETSFLNRYEKLISERTTHNITPAKAALSVETMSAYFDNLEKTIEGIPPQNIANYDETTNEPVVLTTKRTLQTIPGQKKQYSAEE